jgi:prepilin-type processing-associated H-X9-DG protein
MQAKFVLERQRSLSRPDPGCIVRARGRIAALTITELLMVIAILSILSSLLLSGLTRAKSAASQSVCLNHSRQLLQAWLMYSHDFSEELVPNVDGLLGGDTNWVAGNMGDGTEAPSSLLLDRSRSLLSPYIQEAALFKCPSDRSHFVRSVSMNCYLNPTRDPVQGPPRWVASNLTYPIFRGQSQIVTPSNIYVILDEDSRTINDAYFAVDLTNTGNEFGQGPQNPYYIIDFPAAYHANGSTVSFADGHSIVKVWLAPSTFNEVRTRKHLQQPNVDAAWIQTHCTLRN